MSRIDRKDQIIAAALELFRSKGFADVSTRDLAEHAGLSRSHVYHYFSDWNELRGEAFVRLPMSNWMKCARRWWACRGLRRWLVSCATACRAPPTPAGRYALMLGTRRCTILRWPRLIW